MNQVLAASASALPAVEDAERSRQWQRPGTVVAQAAGMSNVERKSSSGSAADEPADGDLREQLGVLGEDLRVLGRQVKALAARQVHAAGDRASALADDLGECVRDRPVQSLLTAAGIGVLAGILLGRR